MVAVLRSSPHEPAVPNGPEELAASVHDAMRSLLRRLQPVLEDEGISMGQFWGLHAISSLGPTSVNSVAHKLLVSAPTACANLDTLVRAGFLERRRSEADRRRVELALTAKGREAESRVWRAIAVAMSEGTRGFSRREISAAARVFRALVEHLEADEDGTARSRRAS